MSVVKEKYGNLKDGREVSLFTITNNNGIKAVITDFGATLVKLFVPNKDGVVKVKQSLQYLIFFLASNIAPASLSTLSSGMFII